MLCSFFLFVFCKYLSCLFMCTIFGVCVRVRVVLVYLFCTTEIMCHISKYLNAENYYS